MRKIFVVISFILVLPVRTMAMEVQAPQAYMIDLQTGTVLLEKNADQKMAPSSMSKIMTAHIIFERLKSGDLKLNDNLLVSEKAWRMGGSKMFVKVNTQVPVEDLLYGTIVHSGNDACVALAEGVYGSESAFAEEMTNKAHEMGAIHSNFVNASGWPAEGHVSTARDLALIAERTIQDFPNEYKKYYAIKEYTYNNIKQGNRNTLLYKNMGADGVKTGHTDSGGYGSVVSAKQGDRRLILVINGLPTMKARDQEATNLLNWGFTYFKNHKIFGKGAVVEVAEVTGGVEKSVQLVSAKDIILTLPRAHQKDLKIKVVYKSPPAAPLKAGHPIGDIEVSFPDKRVEKFPLLVAKDIPQAGVFQRIGDTIYHFLHGKNS